MHFPRLSKNFSCKQKAPTVRTKLPNIQKRSGDPNPQYFSKSTAVQMGGVLPYKWEAYCSTNGRRIAGSPFLRSLEARKVRRYEWGAYCRTNWRCTAVLFRQVVGVGVSETLPKYTCKQRSSSGSKMHSEVEIKSSSMLDVLGSSHDTFQAPYRQIIFESEP